MRVRFWGTRGSMPVALTAADVRDKLAQALIAADGRRFESFGAAYDFARRELPFALGVVCLLGSMLVGLAGAWSP